MNRQFSKWFGSRPVMYWATPANPASSQGSGDGGAGATGGGGAPPVPAAPAPGGAPATPAAPAPGQTGIENLRKEYDGLKSKYEPWEKLGIQPDAAQLSHGVYTRIFQEAGGLGRELGYPDAEIVEALKEDPIATIDFLRNEAFQRQQGRGNQDQGDDRDLAQQIQERIDQAIGPIRQQENLRITNEANAIFERTTHQLIAELFTKEGIDIGKASQDEVALLTNATSEIMKYDEQALKDLKFGGKTAGIQKAFQEAVTMIDKYYLARAARERGAVGGGPRPGAGQQPQGGQPGKKPSLDEMINDPDSIRRAQGKSGYQS
jgi:hypothetical protein